MDKKQAGKAKSFNVSDCYPVGGDWWDLQPTKISFANSIWGERPEEEVSQGGEGFDGGKRKRSRTQDAQP